MRSSSCCCVKSRNYDPSDRDALVTVPLCVTEPETYEDLTVPLVIDLSEGGAGDA